MSRDTSRAESHPGSVMSVNNSDTNPSDIVDKIAGNVADSIAANACLGNDASSEDADALRAENQRLRAELAGVRRDLETAGADLGRSSDALQAREMRLIEANQTIEELRRTAGAQEREASGGAADLEARLRQAQGAIEEMEDRLREAQESDDSAKDQLKKCTDELAKSQREAEAARHELEKMVQEHTSLDAKVSRDTALEDENSVLRERVSSLEEELQSMSKDAFSAKPTVELPPEPTEDNAVLTEAYKQISSLNTQLARLYAELTMARAEAQHLRGGAETQEASPGEGGESVGGGGAAAAEASQKHSQQIADLVSDIRHLQLDLEYHQQKLDQMIGEKHQLMEENKRLQSELTATRQSLEEVDQMLKHREVDLDHLREEAKTRGPAAQGGGGAGDSETLGALRAEAAAKDSALIVSHYELHKEKLVRDRLEQKNAKLMERMQKLMMVVESMRKENGGLERALRAKEQLLEEKDAKMREASRKAKLMQNKVVKSPSKKALESLDFEAPSGHDPLPQLDSARRRQIDAVGTRSGTSTPRSRGATQSPYTR